MAFRLTIPGPTNVEVDLGLGKTVIFVGANGAGKTRLAFLLEINNGDQAHRIAAHRALALQPAVSKTTEEEARRRLSGGSGSDRPHNRWANRGATHLLNDFDALIQVLFADQTNVLFRNDRAFRSGTVSGIEAPKFLVLEEIWERLLPQRRLVLSGDDIRVSTIGETASYSASELSDGERAVFYLIGQVLVAKPNSLLIVDEPELHVHRSILAKLWDELQGARPDCSFVLITHDLDFAASRSAEKFVIRDYSPVTHWTVERVPEDTGFSEEITTLILGSRRPILFVEGENSSLDMAVYRACYPGWTVIHRGGCEAVIHSVRTMRRNDALTRVACRGIVDADDRTVEEEARLRDFQVAVLPVSEIENLVLLPTVSRAIAEHEGLVGSELQARLQALEEAIFQLASSPEAINSSVLEACRRRVDRALKLVDLSDAATPADLARVYAQQTAGLDIAALAAETEAKLRRCIADRDLPRLLTMFAHKGMLVKAASCLKNTSRIAFEEWLARVLRGDLAPAVKAAIQEALPAV
jgi:ABC-type branched-subunit amino acid transport system ATPase component